jgi:hypothetical protein
MAKPKKLIKAYKASFTLLWTKDDIKGIKGLHNKNGTTNKRVLKQQMANELIERMADIVRDETMPVAIEFQEIKLED